MDMVIRTLNIDKRLKVLEIRHDGYAAQYKKLRIIASLEMKSDGKTWLHGSVSLASRQMPTYEDLKKMKELVFGPERTAVQIFPPADRHIDIAGKQERPLQVLHLYGQYDYPDWLPHMEGEDGQL